MASKTKAAPQRAYSIQDLINEGIAYTPESTEATAAADPQTRTWGQAVGDTAVQLAEGVNTTLGAVPSIVAPDGAMAGFFRDNADYWRDKQSDVLKQRIAATDQRIQEAGKEGVLSQIGTAASEYWNDPAQAARLVATNLPSMAATLGTGALAGAAAKGAAAARGLSAAKEAALVAQYGTRTAMAANAALNAGGARGEAYEDLKRAALAQGMSPEQAEQAALDGSIMPGVVGGVAGAVSGKLGLEKALLGQPGAGAGTALRRAAGAFGAELAGEQIEEVAPKLTTNYEAGRIDPARSLTDDLGRTMVETAIGAGPGAVVAGGVEGVRTPSQEAADAIRANEKLPESGALTKAVNAGVEAKAQAVEAGAPLLADDMAQSAPDSVDDPVRDRILALPDGARQDALRAYAVVNRTDVAKGVVQYNRKLLDRLLTENQPSLVLGERLTDTDMGAMLGGGGMMGSTDPLMGALGMNRESQANSITNVAQAPTQGATSEPQASQAIQAVSQQPQAGSQAIASPATPAATQPTAIGGSGVQAAGVSGQAPRMVLQNRDRSTPSSIAQMRSIAAKPDYGRLGFSRDFANGAPVVSGGTIQPAQLGRSDSATASNGRRIPVQYAVVDAANVLPSNNVDGSSNENYGNETIDAVRAIAGNGRIAGLQEAYRSGNATAYRQELEQDAALHGIDPAVISTMQQPVLVRVMPAAEVTADIGDISNTVGNLDLSAVEQANNDANRVSLDALQFAEDGGITPDAVRQFVRAMPQSEQGGLMDTNGQPTKQAVDRLNAAVFAKAYGNDDLVRLFAQAQDPEARNVLSALAQVAPKMARLEGAGALDIRNIVTQAAEIAVNARRQGVALARMAEQQDMAADPLVGEVLSLFARNARTVRPVVDALGAAADFAYTEATKPAEDMFGPVPRATRDDVINTLRPLNERTSQADMEQPAGSGTVQGDAIGQGADTGAAPDPEPAQAGRPAEDAGQAQGRTGPTSVNEPAGEFNVRQQFSLFGQEEGDQLQLFIDSGPVPSQAGAGAVAAQREAVAAIADMESVASILAKSLSRDFAARQKVRLVGHTVSSAADLALLAQVYRDPRFETFRLVFTDNNGRVVSQLGITSRLPASATVIVGDDMAAYLREVSNAAKKTGATSYYMLHNHPSGQATPSGADLQLTKTFARWLPGMTLRSHVVIDTNQYSVIDANGKPQFFQQDFAQPPQVLTGPLAGEVIASPSDVVRMAQSLQADAGAITLIATDAQFKVKAVSSIPAATLSGSKGLVRLKIARALMRLHSANVFAVGRDVAGLRKLGGIVVDALHVKDDGSVDSLASAGVIASKNLGAFPEDRRARVTPDTTENFAYLRFDPSAMQSAGQKMLVRETMDLFGDMQEDAAPQTKKQADKAKTAAERAADAAEARGDERKRIAQASVRAADNFELGQNPLDSLTGQGSIFDYAPEQPASRTPEIRYELPPEKSAQQQGDESWMAAQSPSFKPTARQQLLMDAVAKALDDGAFRSRDLEDRVAQTLGVTPEQRARNSHNVDGGDFGYDVYGARKAVEAQRESAKSREFSDALSLKPGDALGTLVFNDGKVTTGVKVVSLNESGLIATITGKRGAATLNGEVGVDAIASAIDRAKERGKRSDGYVEFVESKVAPIDAAEQEPTKAAAPAATIEDAGEKIGGARKDRWKERGLNLDDLDAMTEAEGAELATKANVWKPDYEALSGASEPVTAALVKTIYDQLAAKPKKNTPEGRRQYVQMMRIVRDVYTEAKGPEAVKNAYLEIRKRAGLNAADPAAKSAGRELLFSVYKGRSDPFVLGYTEMSKAKKLVEDGFPAKADPWKSRLSVSRMDGGPGTTERGIEIYVERSAEVGTPLTREQILAGFYRVNTKDSKTVAYAPTKADAEAAAATVYERDMKGKKDGKPEPVRPNLDELKRENLPQRIDRDVTSEDFVRDLGFRGVEFGNWSAQDERQRILNMAYDGLMDLAEIMGVPPKAMSLNGTLGMAFGARGGGRFAAHYEPGKLVINMTKIRGGGSMAHEWAHAMDHYFGELDKADAYTTQARGASGWYSEDQYNGVPRTRHERVGNEWKAVNKMRLDNLRPEMAAAFDEVMRALFQKQITKAEMVRSQELDLERTEALARNEQDADMRAMYANMAENKRQALNELRNDPEGKLYAGRGRSDYASQAQALSGKSVDGYWVRPTEMFARAFESWVFDRVTAMGARSDYLVHGVEEDRFAGGGYKGNPYPTGEERARINAAFDKLAGTIQTKQTDKGVAMFSRAPATKAAYEARIDALFAGEKAAGPNSGARVLDRSDVLGLLGFGDGPVNLAEGKVIKGQENHPRMTAEQWKKVPEWLDNPAAVFDSDTVPGALVLIAPETINGATVRMTVEPRKGGGADVHILSNAYDAPGFTPFARWFREGLGRLVDQKKFPAVLGDSGLQLSSSTWQNKPGMRNILTEKHLDGYRRKSTPAAFMGQPMPPADSNARNVATQLLVDGLKAKWTRAPEIIVARNMQDAQIPKAVRDYDALLKSQGATGEARGFIYKGKVYLLSDKLKGPEQIAEVLFHEVLGHYGLHGAFGEALTSILQQMGTMRRRDVVAKAREYGLFDSDVLGGLDKDAASDAQIWAAMSPKDRLSAAEEVLAEMAQTQPTIGFVQRAIAAIRNWLRAHVPGFERMRLTDADIVQAYILPARGYVTRSQETAQQAIDRAMLAFSRSPGDAQTMTEEQARQNGFTLKAYRGISKSKPFNDSGTTWLTTSREVAEAYAEEVMGYDDPGVLEVMVKPDGLPRHDASRLTDEQREAFGADEFGNPQAMGIYDRSDDHPLGGSRGNVTVIHAPRDAVVVLSGNANNGNNPDIRFSRTTEAAKAAGDAIKSVTVTNIKQRAGFKLTDYLGIGLQALGRRQIVDIYGDMLPLGEYNRLVQQMEADKNEGSAEADQLVKRWAKLEDEGKLADLMHDATLAQIDPAEDFVEGDDKGKYLELRRKYNLLSDDAKKVYADTRDSYKAHHAKVRSAIKERIERSEIKGERKAALLKQMDDEFFKAIKGVYFPLARFGQYAVTVKGPDGKVESVSRAETKAEAEALRSSLLSAFPRDKGFTVGRVMLSKDFIADRDAVGRGFMTELYQVLDQQNMDAAQRAELEDTLGQLYLSSLPDLSWAKHGIHRKGTPGFSQDARRAFAQNMFHGARYLAKLRYSDLMQDELTAMQRHVDDWREVEDFDQNSAQRVVDEMNKRHESLMNPTSNPLSTALTSLGFVFHLGLSPASAMVNLSQTALVAYPIMGAKWGFNKASAALLKASKEAAAGKNDITGSLNADERAAYDEAVRAGTIDVTMAHDLAGIAQGEDAGVMWKIRPVMRYASFLFHHAERFNRQVTFVAAYRLAREAGADHKAAFDQATKATYDGHFDYGACVDDATEILTATGWKKRADLKVGDIAIATDASGRAVESKVLAVNVYEGDREVIEFKSKNRFSMVLTPNHDAVIQSYNSRDKKWQGVRKVRADFLKQSHFILRTPLAPLEKPEGIYGDDFAALLGWIAAEGWYSKYRKTTAATDVRIGQSVTHNPEYVAEIRGILERLGGEFKEYTYQRSRDVLTTFVLRRSLGRRIQECLPEKVLTPELVKSMSTSEMRAFLMAFLKGDGTKYETGRAWAVGQKNGANLDLLQAMATMCGMRATLSQVNGNGVAVLYVVPEDTGARSHVRPLEQTRRTEPLVWCPTTEHGTWIARRNGAAFVTGNSNRPRIMQGNVAKVLLLFKQYGQNMVYTLARNAQQAIKAETPEARAQARKALGGLLATHAMAAGVLGLPMVTTLLAAASMVGGDDDDPWDAKVALQNMLADTFGQKPAEVLAHGLSRLTPWDISGRVGLDRLIFPDVQEGLEGQRLAESAMAAALGPVAGIGVNVLKGAQHMSEGRYAMGLEAMMPSALRGPVKALRYANEGVQDKSGVSILDEVSPAAVAGQALGFSPSQARNAQEGKSAVMAHDRALGERRQELLSKAARASMEKDADARAKAMKEIERFNQKNPTRRITPLNVLQSVRNRNKRIEQAEGGIYLPKARRDAMGAGRFAVGE